MPEPADLSKFPSIAPKILFAATRIGGYSKIPQDDFSLCIAVDNVFRCKKACSRCCVIMIVPRDERAPAAGF